MRALILDIFFLVVALWAEGCHPKSDGPPTPGPIYGHPTSYTLPLPYYFSTRSDTAEAALTVEGIALGKMLFNDSALSADGKVSCRSCHLSANGFADPRTVSLGVHAQPGTRNALALINLAFESHLFWDGREKTLETMLIQPMTRPDEMGLSEGQINTILKKPRYDTLFGKAFEGQAPSFLLARRAISMYVRSLVSGDTKYDRYLLGTYSPTTEELQGMRLFFTHPDPISRTRGGNCGDCHQSITTAGNTFSFNGFKNNGLPVTTARDYGLEKFSKDTNDRGKFKIPTLRNIAFTAPYMHDGRFTTLQQVLDHYNDLNLFHAPNVDPLIPAAVNTRNGTSLGLSSQEKADIITFLHMLTDSTALLR